MKIFPPRFNVFTSVSGGSGSTLSMSPYQHELARLRMERLRIEETHILQVKRQEELERIRGPQPKWFVHYKMYLETSPDHLKCNFQASKCPF